MAPSFDDCPSPLGLRVHFYNDKQPYINTSSEEVFLEDICKEVAKEIGITTVTFPLFGLVDRTHKVWYGLHNKVTPAKWTEGPVYFRVRFPPAKKMLKRQDWTEKCSKFVEYLYCQCRDDLLADRMADLFGQEIKKDQVYGLGVLERLIHSRSHDISILTVTSFTESLPQSMRNQVSSWRHPLKTLRFNQNCANKLRNLNEGMSECKLEELLMRFINGVYQYVPNYLIETYNITIQLSDGSQKQTQISVNPTQEVVSDVMLSKIQSIEMKTDTEGSGAQVLIHAGGVPKVLLFDEEALAESFVSAVVGFYRLTVNFYHSLCARVELPSLKQLHKLCHGPISEHYCRKLLAQTAAHQTHPYILRQSSQFDQLQLVYRNRTSGRMDTSLIERLPDGKFKFQQADHSSKDLLQLIKTERETQHLVDAIPRRHEENGGLLLCLEEDVNSLTGSSEEGLLPQVEVPCLSQNDVTVLSVHLGSGLFTEVFEGVMERAGTTKSVAVKRLKSAWSHQCLESFLVTAHMMRKVQSGNIVKLLGVCLLPPFYMVLEMAPHGDLERYLRNYKSIVKPPQLIQAMNLIMGALQHLSKICDDCFLAHGNIRCRNILVFYHETVNLEVKLGDQGMTHLFNQLPMEHPCNEERRPWLAPELLGNLKALTQETDMFAFGTTIWEMWSKGAHPSEADLENTPESLLPHEKDSDWLKKVKPVIVQLINSCREDDPTKRINLLDFQRTSIPLELGCDSNTDYSGVEESDGVSVANTESRGGASGEPYPRLPDLQPTRGDRPTIPLPNDPEPPSLNGFVFDDGQWRTTPVLDTESRGCVSGQQPASQWNPSSHLANDKECDTAHPSNRPLPEQPRACRNAIQISKMIPKDSVLKYEEIGKGHFGVVHKGKLKNNVTNEWEDCAVKILLQNTEGAQFTNSGELDEEVKIMCLLSHENVITTYGFCLSDKPDPFWLIMEFMENGSLYATLRALRDSRKDDTIRRKLTNEVVFGICDDVALGMKYLVSQKLVHRDLAARNVLLTSNYHAKITDFGLARILGENDYYRMKTDKPLPLHYYSPESLAYWLFTEKGDVWSYGILLWEIYTLGSKPTLVEETNSVDGAVLLDHLKEGKRLPKPKGCPELAWTLMNEKCWVFNEDRRATFEEIVNYLKLHRNWQTKVVDV